MPQKSQLPTIGSNDCPRRFPFANQVQDGSFFFGGHSGVYALAKFRVVPTRVAKWNGNPLFVEFAIYDPVFVLRLVLVRWPGSDSPDMLLLFLPTRYFVAAKSLSVTFHFLS